MTASVPPGATNTARSVTVDGSDHSSPHRATQGARRWPGDPWKPVAEGPKRCPREHALSGYNRLPNGGCRACLHAIGWAKRRNRFNDDPQVLERANQAYARYLESPPINSGDLTVTSGNVPEIGDPALVDYAGDQANARRALQARIDEALARCDHYQASGSGIAKEIAGSIRAALHAPCPSCGAWGGCPACIPQADAEAGR